MGTTTRQQNFKKHPHTANFLMKFHAADGVSRPAEITEDGRMLDSDGNPWIDPAERAAMDFLTSDAPAEEYVAPVVEAAPARAARPVAGYLVEFQGHQVRCGDGFISEAQAKWIVDILVKREVAGAEQTFIRLEQGLAKYAGSQFINANKNAPLKPVAPVATPAATVAAPAVTAEIPNGRYGIHRDGEVKCYKVGNGKAGTRWDGFVFLDRISSDDLFPIRRADEKAEILAAIGADVDAANLLAALTLRKCRRCGRQLSDTKNPYFGEGLGPECGGK